MYGYRMFAYPVGVQLFNRPEYAEMVLRSLKGQSFPIDQARLYIYIDGFKGSIYETKGALDKTKQVEELAREIFPGANVVRFENNCGIADLHNKLQEATFARDDLWAAFFEEDLILDPNYLKELSELIEIVDDSEAVVKVACFQIINSLFHLPRGHNGFYPGRGTKAFAERKSFYLEKAPILKYFVELQKRTDLPKPKVSKRNPFPRDAARLSLLAHPKRLGFLLTHFNKDAVSDVFLQTRGKLHVVSKPTMAIDIGLEGVHNSVQVNLQVPQNHKNSIQSLEMRSTEFHNSLEQIRIEAENEMVTIHRNILDGYFLSLSGKAMLKKVTQKSLMRVASFMPGKKEAT